MIKVLILHALGNEVPEAKATANSCREADRVT
jgi:hypothetical protein